MVTNSYSASCYIENDNGQYHMECEMISDDKEVYADYDGKSFIDGLNQIMNDLTAKIIEKPQPKPQTPEEKIDSLEKLVKQLQDENKKLNALVNSSNTENNKTKEFKYSDYIENILNEYFNNYDLDNHDLDNLLKEIKIAPSIFHFPVKK